MVSKLCAPNLETIEKDYATPPREDCITERNDELSLENIPHRSKIVESHKSAYSTLKEKGHFAKTDIVMTVQQLKAMTCRGGLVSEIELKKVDILANEIDIAEMFNPFKSPRLHFLTTKNSPTCAIVIKGNHRVAAVSKQGLIKIERETKVFAITTHVSERMFANIWAKARSLSYSDLEMPFDRVACPKLILDIYNESLAQDITKQRMVLETHTDYYMAIFSQIYTEEEREGLADNEVQQIAEFEKWFGIGVTKKRREQRKMFSAFYMQKQSQRYMPYLKPSQKANTIKHVS